MVKGRVLISAMSPDSVPGVCCVCHGCPVQGTPVFNAPTLSAKGLLQFAQGVLVLRKQYRSMLSPPMFDSPRAIRWV